MINIWFKVNLCMIEDEFEMIKDDFSMNNVRLGIV